MFCVARCSHRAGTEECLMEIGLLCAFLCRCEQKVFDEWLRHAIEELVADKEHVNRQRALVFRLFVQSCIAGILQAESLKAW